MQTVVHYWQGLCRLLRAQTCFSKPKNQETATEEQQAPKSLLKTGNMMRTIQQGQQNPNEQKSCSGFRRRWLLMRINVTPRKEKQKKMAKKDRQLFRSSPGYELNVTAQSPSRTLCCLRAGCMEF